MVIIKGLGNSDLRSGMTSDEIINAEANTHGIEKGTTKPLNVPVIAEKIGDNAALLIVSMLAANPQCSKLGVEKIIDIIHSIAGRATIHIGQLDLSQQDLVKALPYYPRIYMNPKMTAQQDRPSRKSAGKFTRPLNFTLKSAGFLNESELVDHPFINTSFTFIPEAKYSRATFRDGLRGSFSFDLEIRMHALINIPKIGNEKAVSHKVKIATACIEFDGHNHYRNDIVLKDKNRDSMTASFLKKTFRIQTPLPVEGKGAVKTNQDNLDALVNERIVEVRNFFRNSLLLQLRNANPITEALKAEQRVKGLLIK